jgi:hypothetical protein
LPTPSRRTFVAGLQPIKKTAPAALAADRRQVKEMRQRARELAAAEFDRERIYPRFADWLETLS